MNKLISWLEGSFAPKMNKLVQNAYISSIKNSVMNVLPLIFLGSIFSLLTIPENFVEGWPNFWTPQGWTFGMVSLFVAFLVPFNVLEAKGLHKSRINGGIAGVILFLMSLNTQFVADQTAALGTDAIAFARISAIGGMGAGGMFVAIVMGVVAALVMSAFGKFSFFKEDSVMPDFVKAWFDSMLPIGILVVAAWLLTDSAFLGLNLYQMIVDLFMPLQNIANTPFGFVFILFLFCFLYSMGISSWVLTPVITPIFLANAEANIALVQAGEAGAATLAPLTDAFVYSGYLWIGGIGCTMSLVLMMAFMCKSGQLRGLGRACIVPSIFNINEPVVFGVVAWNPIMMLPMWLNGIILPLVSFVFTKIIPLAPIPDMLFNMWYCPFPIATWLTTGSVMGIVLMLAIFALSFVIWMPFLRVYDKQLVEQEAAYEDEDEE